MTSDNMLKKLKKWLDENGIEYNVTYGGPDKDIENIEVGDLSIIEDIEETKYCVCDTSTINFKWAGLEETKEILLNEVPPV